MRKSSASFSRCSSIVLLCNSICFDCVIVSVIVAAPFSADLTLLVFFIVNFNFV